LAPTGVLVIDVANMSENDNLSSDDGETAMGTFEKENSAVRTSAENTSYNPQVDLSGFEQLVIPLGNKRKAIINMPSDATAEEADYVKDMLVLMFKKLYGIRL